MTNPQIIGGNKAGTAVTGEPAVCPEHQGGLPDQSLPRSPQSPTSPGVGLVGLASPGSPTSPDVGLVGVALPERPSFTQWWREYQEKMRSAQESFLACHPLQQFVS
ncbi:MAG TPA: hypothetical protein VE783_13695 [Candidatus Limnocylindrales bacterium]|nr:hypothetical protein [Candidatus Limnocylindrales bacterium]